MKNSSLLMSLATVLTLALATSAHAHDPGLSSLTVRSSEGGVTFLLLVDDAALSPRRRGTHCAAEGVLAGSIAGRAVPVRVSCRAAEAQHTAFEGSLEVPRAGELTLTLALLQELPRGHRSYLRMQDVEGHTESDRMLARGSEAVALQVSAARSADFFWLGVEHILTGFDHLLFLGVLLLGVEGLRRMAAVVSCFTLAHSMTLALASMRVVVLPSSLVEPLIAASVVFVALRGCFFTQPVTERLLVTFVFGLVHGLGFASALEALGATGRGFGTLGPLLRFNLGVETGQLAVGLVCLPLLARVRHGSCARLPVRQLLSGVGALVGLFWLLQRTLG